MPFGMPPGSGSLPGARRIPRRYSSVLPPALDLCLELARERREIEGDGGIGLIHRAPQAGEARRGLAVGAVRLEGRRVRLACLDGPTRALERRAQIVLEDRRL